MACLSVRAWLRISAAVALVIFPYHPRPSIAAEAKSTQLPLKKVVLFNSGVGFFQHDGRVDGNVKVEMKFNVEDINDLLKSMVLQDLNGGQISTVNYGSKDPITKTLQTFAVDLTSDTTLADLLRQIRGEKIQVDAPNPITGVILGVETRLSRNANEEVTSTDILNLVTATGLRAIPLNSVRETRLLDERLNSELQQALAILAMSHAVDKKSVTLNFTGQGLRAVRVGYIQESPIWKTSYRLVLDDNKPPYLQGWAIVENTSEQDWDEVGLTLISGRPISFLMNLYEPLYVGRPMVEPELFASLRPQTHDQDLEEREKQFRALASNAAGRSPRRPRFTGSFGGMGGGGFFGGSPPASGDVVAGSTGNAAPMDPSQGVKSAAEAAEVGELFRYSIDTPVSLPRQQSAMIPIVNDSLEGEKLSIYNREVHAKHPLNGVKFTNTTKLHLMQGPITVFDGGEYAGDAQIQDLPPAGKRLISYALDLDTEVALSTKQAPEQLVSARITGKVFHSTHRRVRTHSYLIKTSGSHAKKILIEQPIEENWKLFSTRPTETTRDLYRFAVTAEPGTAITLTVEEELLEFNTQPISGSLKDLALEIINDDLEYTVVQTDDLFGDPVTDWARRPALPAEVITSVTLSKGKLRESRQQSRRNAFTFRNSGDKPQLVTVEFPVDPEWTLAAASNPKERTPDLYRYEVTVEPGKLGTVRMDELSTVTQDWALQSLDDSAIVDCLNAKATSPVVKASLSELRKRRDVIAKIEVELQQTSEALKTVDQEQNRIRQNMLQLERASELYKRYVKKFGEQEDQVESLRMNHTKLTNEAAIQRDKLQDFLENLDAK